jgi:hypothetical protein
MPGRIRMDAVKRVVGCNGLVGSTQRYPLRFAKSRSAPPMRLRYSGDFSPNPARRRRQESWDGNTLIGVISTISAFGARRSRSVNRSIRRVTSAAELVWPSRMSLVPSKTRTVPASCGMTGTTCCLLSRYIEVDQPERPWFSVCYRELAREE